MPYGNLLADVVQGSTANTPPVFKDGNGTTIGTLCRAWVNFNGTGTVAIRASFNVSSITDNGTGDYTVNFTTALSDANYSVVCSNVVVSDQGSSYSFGTKVNSAIGNAAALKSTSQIQVLSRRESSVDIAEANVAIFR